MLGTDLMSLDCHLGGTLMDGPATKSRLATVVGSQLSQARVKTARIVSSSNIARNYLATSRYGRL